MIEHNTKKIIKISTLCFFFLFILVFAFFKSRDLVFGIKIKNINIADGSTVHDDVLNLTGNAKNAVNLTLNGREISVDQAGNWNETIALAVGYNVINIKAKDRFGYVDEKNYKLINEATN